MDWWRIFLYVLFFWLGSGAYAAFVAKPFGRGSAFNLVLLMWVPIYLAIVFVWHPL